MQLIRLLDGFERMVNRVGVGTRFSLNSAQHLGKFGFYHLCQPIPPCLALSQIWGKLDIYLWQSQTYQLCIIIII